MNEILVLLAEDELLVAEDIQINLENLGYHVPEVIVNGEDIIDAVERLQPQIVLMDIMLKGEMDGIDAAQLIRNRFDIPVIYLTSYSDLNTLERAKTTEPFGYILKPFHADSLQSTIEMALYKHQAEQQIRENEAWLWTTLKSIGEAVIVTDDLGTVCFMNHRAEALTGYHTDEISGQRLTDFLNLCDEVSNESIRWAIPDESAGSNHSVAENVILKSRDGQTIPIEETVALIVDARGRKLGAVTVFRDVTRQRAFQQSLQKTEVQLRNYSAHLQTIREEERTRIAREIHDELGQTMTALKMDISWMHHRVSPDQKTIFEKLNAMTQLIDQTIGSVKRIATELRPGLLDDLGLAAAIEWQTEEFKNRTGMTCQVIIEPEVLDVDEALSTALFRILQETLTNIIRHAEATAVLVKLIQDESGIAMSVKDNGKGIETSEKIGAHSYGMIGIRERVAYFGGFVQFQSDAASGTTVQIQIPASGKSKKENGSDL